jgi:hypothetical protein
MIIFILIGLRFPLNNCHQSIGQRNSRRDRWGCLMSSMMIDDRLDQSELSENFQEHAETHFHEKCYFVRLISKKLMESW